MGDRRGNLPAFPAPGGCGDSGWCWQSCGCSLVLLGYLRTGTHGAHPSRRIHPLHGSAHVWVPCREERDTLGGMEPQSNS